MEHERFPEGWKRRIDQVLGGRILDISVSTLVMILSKSIRVAFKNVRMPFVMKN